MRATPPARALAWLVDFIDKYWGAATQRPNGLIYLAYVAAALVALGTLTTGIGLLRA